MSEQRDLYETLGVDAGANREAIVHAYRRQAHESHPDTRPGDPAAAERFRQLTAAYDVLVDPSRRRAYDRQRGLCNQPRPDPPARPAAPATSWAATTLGGETVLAVGPVHIDAPFAHHDAAPLLAERLNTTLTVGPTMYAERRYL